MCIRLNNIQKTEKNIMSRLYDIFSESEGVTTDSRSIRPGSIFFALRGETFDGNRFAVDALKKGAAYAVVDDP